MCHLEHYCATLVSWPSHAHRITADQRMHSLLALPRGMCRIGGLAVNLVLQLFGCCLIQLRHETFACNRSVHPHYFTPDLGLTSFPGLIRTLARNPISVPTSLATTKPARTQEVAHQTSVVQTPPRPCLLQLPRSPKQVLLQPHQYTIGVCFFAAQVSTLYSGIWSKQ